jgi:hypothetical protein
MDKGQASVFFKPYFCISDRMIQMQLSRKEEKDYVDSTVEHE